MFFLPALYVSCQTIQTYYLLDFSCSQLVFKIWHALDACEIPRKIVGATWGFEGCLLESFCTFPAERFSEEGKHLSAGLCSRGCQVARQEKSWKVVEKRLLLSFSGSFIRQRFHVYIAVGWFCWIHYDRILQKGEVHLYEQNYSSSKEQSSLHMIPRQSPIRIP